MIPALLAYRKWSAARAETRLALADRDGRYSYGAERRLSPTALLLTGTVVALVGAGLATTQIQMDILPTTILKGRQIPLDPPTKAEPVKLPEATIKPATVITLPPAPLQRDSAPRLDAVVVRDPGPAVPLTPNAGTMPNAGPAETIVPSKTIEPPPTPFAAPQFDRRFAGDLQPPYPPAMERAEKEGNVSLKVLVGTDGRVRDVLILSASDPAFAEAARKQALAKWRFKPAMRGENAEEAWFTTSIRFRLDQR